MRGYSSKLAAAFIETLARIPVYVRSRVVHLKFHTIAGPETRHSIRNEIERSQLMVIDGVRLPDKPNGHHKAGG